MNKKFIIGICIFSLVVLLVIQQIVIRNNIDKEEDANTELVNSIKELSSKLDSLESIKDSVIFRIDTTKVKIIELEKRYETTRDSIVTQSVDADCVTFSEYISNYKHRLSSNNNFGTTQDY